MPGALTIALDFIILIVILFLAWYVTRIVASHSGVTGKGKYITVIEKIAVSKDCTVVLMKCCGKLLLVGVTPHSMTTLSEISEENAGDVGIEEPKKESFAEIFKRSLDVTLPDGKIKDAVVNFVNKRGGGGDDKT